MIAVEPYPFPPAASNELDVLLAAARFVRSLGQERTARRLEARARWLDLRLLGEELAALDALVERRSGAGRA